MYKFKMLKKKEKKSWSDQNASNLAKINNSKNGYTLISFP